MTPTRSLTLHTTAAAGRFDGRAWLRWVPTFLGFPIAGLAARAVVGAIDDTSAALVGGLTAGAVLGAVQSLALSRSTAPRARWIVATAVGLSLGLGLGATTVDHATDPGSLVAMGAISGLGVGLAQAAAMRARPWRRATWVVATPVLWALGWWITSTVIVDADRQHANFGASGALVVTVLGGLVLAVADDGPHRR